MKSVKIMLFGFLVLGLGISLSLAAGHDPEERGKALFNDPGFAGGTTPCSGCHPNGRGLEMSGEKKEFNLGGQTQGSLEEAVNYCIVVATGGKAIPVDSPGMEDIVAYIKSLK